MSNKEKLLARAKASPNNLTFDDLRKLAELHGWTFKRSKGSHWIFENEALGSILNLQNRKGKAKPYQVRQLLDLIEDL